MRSTNSTSLKYDKDVFIKIKREFFDLCYFWQFEVTIISHSGNLPSMREEQKEFFWGGGAISGFHYLMTPRVSLVIEFRLHFHRLFLAA